ncbi:MAG: sulfotransferase [Rhodobacteraceae bacterium]|nr:sulfotransferase [Paracoccaceae bacterium]
MSPADVLILRTHAADPGRAAAVARFLAIPDLRLVVAVAGGKGPVDLPEGVAAVALEEAGLAAQGLATPADWGWRCGDYALYAVRAAFPHARFYWLTDSDVVINARPGRFFPRFAGIDADLLAPGVGPRPAGWAHHAAMARFGAEVWGCLFSFLRISGPAIDHLLPARRALLARWKTANAAGPASKWPNDESFVATELKAAGMTLRDLDDGGRQVCGRGWGWHFPIHPQAPVFARPDGRLYHPVAADTAAFLRRIERSLARLAAQGGEAGGRILPGLARALRTLPLAPVTGPGPATGGSEAAEAALAALLPASVLPGLGPGTAALARDLLPPADAGEGAGIIHHAVTGRAPRGWRVAAADDFTLGPPLHFPVLPRGATAYAADFATRRLALVATAPEARLLDAPFFYRAQRESARALAFLPFDGLAAAFPAVTDDRAAPLFVMSPGRCGSTFVNALLGAAGLVAVSEPDVFAQAAGLLGRLPGQEGRDPAAIRADAVAVLRATVASLVRATGSPPATLALKLRSQANPAAAAIRAAFPAARFLFLFRDPEPWVRSFVTAFGHDAPRLVATLGAAVRALAGIADTGAPVAVLAYEEVARDPAAALARLARSGFLPGALPDAQALARIAAADAQAGTAVSRAARAARPAAEAAVEATLSEFRALWPAARPAAAIARFGLSC